MSKAHHRKKQPQAVRQLLLGVAAGLCIERGASGLTLDAVAAAAGVSKGGLLHHFPSKAALLEGLLDDLIDRLDAAIHQAMLDDPDPTGRFTRAYLKVCFVPGGGMALDALRIDCRALRRSPGRMDTGEDLAAAECLPFALMFGVLDHALAKRRLVGEFAGMAVEVGSPTLGERSAILPPRPR